MENTGAKKSATSGEDQEYIVCPACEAHFGVIEETKVRMPPHTDAKTGKRCVYSGCPGMLKSERVKMLNELKGS